MSCSACKSDSLFKEKLGRCKTCMGQLAVLSLISWPLWFYMNLYYSSQIETMIALFACVGFSGLLLAHLLVWVSTGGRGLS